MPFRGPRLPLVASPRGLFVVVVVRLARRPRPLVVLDLLVVLVEGDARPEPGVDPARPRVWIGSADRVHDGGVWVMASVRSGFVAAVTHGTLGRARASGGRS